MYLDRDLIITRSHDISWGFFASVCGFVFALISKECHSSYIVCLQGKYNSSTKMYKSNNTQLHVGHAEFINKHNYISIVHADAKVCLLTDNLMNSCVP